MMQVCQAIAALTIQQLQREGLARQALRLQHCLSFPAACQRKSNMHTKDEKRYLQATGIWWRIFQLTLQCSLQKNYIKRTSQLQRKNKQMALHIHVPCMVICKQHIMLAVRFNGMYVITSQAMLNHVMPEHIQHHPRHTIFSYMHWYIILCICQEKKGRHNEDKDGGIGSFCTIDQSHTCTSGECKRLISHTLVTT